jgi:hypothetical protein
MYATTRFRTARVSSMAPLPCPIKYSWAYNICAAL